MLGRRQFAKLGVLAAPAFSIISNAYAADDELKLALDDASQVTAHNVTVRAVNYRGGRALEVRRVALGKPDIERSPSCPMSTSTTEPSKSRSPAGCCLTHLLAHEGSSA